MLRVLPKSTMNCLNDRIRRNVVQIPSRRGDRPMPQRLGNDPNIDAFGSQLGGMCMSEAVGVDTLSDPGLATETGEEDADVAVGNDSYHHHTPRPVICRRGGTSRPIAIPSAMISATMPSIFSRLLC